MDPGVILTLVVLLVGIFAAALSHKLSDLRGFRRTLVNYRLLPGWTPDRVYSLMVALLLVSEGLVCLMLLFSATRTEGALLAMGLLALYSVGIGINLLRGRRDMDCGCTWGSEKSSLSGWLLLRNGSLLVLAWLMTIEPLQRVFSWQDWLLSALAAVAGLLVYFAADGLISNWSRLRSLRLS